MFFGSPLGQAGRRHGKCHRVYEVPLCRVYEQVYPGAEPSPSSRWHGQWQWLPFFGSPFSPRLTLDLWVLGKKFPQRQQQRRLRPHSWHATLRYDKLFSRVGEGKCKSLRSARRQLAALDLDLAIYKTLCQAFSPTGASCIYHMVQGTWEAWATNLGFAHTPFKEFPQGLYADLKLDHDGQLQVSFHQVTGSSHITWSSLQTNFPSCLNGWLWGFGCPYEIGDEVLIESTSHRGVITETIDSLIAVKDPAERVHWFSVSEQITPCPSRYTRLVTDEVEAAAEA